MIKILMIEDDTDIAELLTTYLFKYDMHLTNYEDPELGISALNIDSYDIVILDLSLPGIDGTDVCRIIREKSSIPIIISSARSDIKDKTICFAYGADDYIPKPYDSYELVLRIRSILKRGTKEENPKIEKKIFEINEDKREIYKNKKVLEFTNAEYNIMKYLISKADFAVSREELLLNISSINYESTSKSIDVLISRIRAKIEENARKPKYIISLRGIGYKLINE